MDNCTEYKRALVNLGCGLHAPAGWINVDGSLGVLLAKHPFAKSVARLLHFPKYVTETPWNPEIIRADLRGNLPFLSASIDVVYSSHALEHLHVEEAKRLMREIFRVLKPGGICRIVVPDGAEAVRQKLVEPLSNAALDRPVAKVRGAAYETINAGVVVPPQGFIGRIWHKINDLHYHKYLYDEGSLMSLFEWAGFSDPMRRSTNESRVINIRDVELESRSSDGSLCMEGGKPDVARM